MNNQYIATNRVLVESLQEILGRSPEGLDLTFEKAEFLDIRSPEGDKSFDITELKPVVNEDEVPPVFKINILDKQFMVIQPEDFFEAPIDYYLEHFPFIFGDYEEEDIVNGEFNYVDNITTDEPPLDLDLSTELFGELDGELISIYLYESTDREDDRVIIITETYNPETETRMINFLDGEEITDIDIDKVNKSL
jgi:hypothetical protein